MPITFPHHEIIAAHLLSSDVGRAEFEQRFFPKVKEHAPAIGFESFSAEDDETQRVLQDMLVNFEEEAE